MTSDTHQAHPFAASRSRTKAILGAIDHFFNLIAVATAASWEAESLM